MSCFEGLRGPGIMFDVQRYMSKAQAIPIVGPILVSPIKAIVSLVELVVGFVFAVVLGTLSVLTSCCSPKISEELGKKAFTAITHAGLGLLSLGYTLGHVCTLGILGLIIEQPWKSSSWQSAT